MTEGAWSQLWRSRQVSASGLQLADLLRADGFDTDFAKLSEDSWRGFVSACALRWSVGPGDSVFEVGSGAGAFSYVLSEMGVKVGGLDISERLVELAKAAIPTGEFAVGEARFTPTEPKWDAVVAMGVFMYFADLAYAEEVLARMARKARRVVALLDLPDLAKKDEAEAWRRSVIGKEIYEERYQDLPHLYFSKTWAAEALTAAGLKDICIEDQFLDPYPNGAFRFNAWGFLH
jgi:cyclopropane fatty-acyl-phospholipid synthase-like methyltransferase